MYASTEILTLTREGEWLSNGEPFGHEPTRSLFSKSLKRRSDGSWWLEIGRESKQVRVEDTAYFVLRIEGDRRSGYETLLSDGSREPLRPETLLLTPGRLTCLTAAGHEARFLRAPYTDLLMQALEEKNGTHEMEIEGRRYELGGPLPSLILFFDGICGLCNRVVDFLMRIDRDGRIYFAPLQGRISGALLPVDRRLNLDTVVLWKDGHCLERSSAVFESLACLRGPWGIIARLGLLIPRFLRDAGYRLVATNRYSWFGRRATCRLPTAAERRRILE